MAYDPELEAFKHIDLRDYIDSQGWKYVRKESWANCSVFKDGSGDKVFVKRNGNGHWIYFSYHEIPNPHKRRRGVAGGTIIDFIQVRKGWNLGQVKMELRPWIGKAATFTPRFPALPASYSSADRDKVEKAYVHMQIAERHPYLEDVRKIPADILASRRFAGRIRIDAKGNAIFPHFDAGGLSGYEIKNSHYTGFASGGQKGLWTSHADERDRRLVFAEAAIDALSYAALFRVMGTRYASIGGKPNPQQPALIQAEIAKMPAESEIIAATDNDEDGEKLAAVIEKALHDTGRSDLKFRFHPPPSRGDDWNDVQKRRFQTNTPLPVARP